MHNAAEKEEAPGLGVGLLPVCNDPCMRPCSMRGLQATHGGPLTLARDVPCSQETSGKTGAILFQYCRERHSLPEDLPESRPLSMELQHDHDMWSNLFL